MGRTKVKQEKKEKAVAPASKSKKSRKKAPATKKRASATKEYEVEELLDYVCNGRAGARYFVKWKDYPHRANTWEPSRNLGNCPDELLRFYESRKAIVEKQRAKGEATWDVPPNPRA